MSLPTSFIPAKKRVRRRRRVVIAAPGALMVVGIPVFGVYEINLEMEIQFNVTEAAPLADVSAPPGADPAKWTARYQGTRYVGSMLQNYEFDKLYLSLAPAGLEAGSDELSYAGPSDISDVLGRELEAFEDMPI